MKFANYIPDKLIVRPVYIGKSEPFIGKDIIKVFTGQRRVGKTYILYQMMGIITKKYINANIIFAGLDLPEFSLITNDKEFLSWLRPLEKAKNNFLFIDEVQEIENFEKALLGLLAEKKWDIWCTGSNASMLSNDIAGRLSGRTIEIPVHGLSYKEFLVFHRLEHSDDSLAGFMKYGGLPYLVNLELKDSVVFEYLKGIYATILYKDIVSREGVRNTQFLESLVMFLAENTGSIVSANKISDFLKSQQINMAPVRVLEYLKYLENAFFIVKARRADLKGKRLFEINQKYYFEDIGLRNTVIGFRAVDIGKLIENVIILHMRNQGFTVHTGSYMDKEVDFVCERRNDRIYIQAAYLLNNDNTIEREFGNLQLLDDNYPKYVVTMDPVKFDNNKGIIHMQLGEFLMTEF
ncbi:MAG: ATP-binding protein [Bacteroidota bacterium]